MDIREHEKLMLAIEEAIDELTEQGKDKVVVDIDGTPINIAGRIDAPGIIVLEIYGAWDWA